MNLRASSLKYLGKQEKIKFHECSNVHFTNLYVIVVPDSVKMEFRGMVLKRKKTFLTSNEALPFNTSVVATKRSVDNELVYSK